MSMMRSNYSTSFAGLKLCITLLLAFFLFACEEKADLLNPDRYDNNGVSFNLPSNWHISDDLQEPGFRYLVVETSGDAIMAMNGYDGDEPFTLEDYVSFIIEGREEELPFGSIDQNSVSDIRLLLDGKEFIGKRNTFNMNLLGQSIPHTADFFMIRSESKTQTAYFFNQSADEDVFNVTEGFKLILSSFVME